MAKLYGLVYIPLRACSRYEPKKNSSGMDSPNLQEGCWDLSTCGVYIRERWGGFILEGAAVNNNEAKGPIP